MISRSSEYRASKLLWERYKEGRSYEDNRQRHNIITKHSFCVACRELTSLSLAEVGSIISKDHATVLHAMKNHESNTMYLQGYRSSYEYVHRELMKSLDYEDDWQSTESISSLKELRNRLVKTSQRLREVIGELHDLKKSYAMGLSEENEFLKRHNKQIHERNKNLEKELARVKNLL